MAASSQHDKIVSFIAGKIQRLGFKIICMEGSHTDVINYSPQLPSKLINHRPDIYGLNDKGAICIGEAKTNNDLNSKRTKTQLSDFRNIIKQLPDNLLIIGIPFGSKGKLITILQDLEIAFDNQIDIMEIPLTFL